MLRGWFLILLVGCGRPVAPLAPASSGAPEPTAPPASGAPEKRAPTPEVRAEIVPLAALGSYRVDLSWTSPTGHTEFWVERTRGLEKRVLAHLQAVAVFQDAEVWPGETIAYSVLAREDEVAWELGTVEVKIPVDKTFATGEHVWEFGAEYGRLRLEKGAVVRIGDRDLELSLFELQSEGGCIESWPAGSQSPGQGARGGRIAIRARRASGRIELISRGQAGGAGAAGAEGQRGAPGAEGRVARYVFDFAGVPGRDLRESWKVESPALPAAAGQTGGPGENGQDGWPGGESGGVSLELETAGEFLPLLISEGGAGGAAGAGGMGGPGGASGLWTGNDGGIPAEYRPRYDAPAAGARGTNGDPGKAGPAGKRGPVSYRVAGKQVPGVD